MASIETALETRAAATAGLTALIGTDPVRLYPTQATQGAVLPYVTYQVISDPPVHVMSADKESQARVQLDVWASTWTSAKAVRDQVLVALDRCAGSFGGTTILGSVCDNRGMQVEPDDTSLTPRLTMEFQMTYLVA